MDLFFKWLGITVSLGFALLGVWTGILLLRIALGVAGFMLGSTLGTLLLAWILWRWYQKNKDNFDWLK